MTTPSVTATTQWWQFWRRWQGRDSTAPYVSVPTLQDSASTAFPRPRGLSAYGAALVACAPIVPLLAAVSIAIAYVAPIRMDRSVPLYGHLTLDGTLLALAAWLLLALVYLLLGFTGVKGANSRAYGELRERLDALSKRLAAIPEAQVSITAPPPQDTGKTPKTFLYSYMVTNDGPIDVSNAQLRLTSPARDLKVTQAPAGWIAMPDTGARDTVRYSAASFPAGAQALLVMEIEFDAPLPVQVAIDATATGLPMHATASLDPAQATTSVIKTAPPLLPSLAVARAHRDAVIAELDPRSQGLRWVLATGYINLWCRVHRAEEALIDIEPRAAVVYGALDDELRLTGSNIDNRDALLATLQAAVQILDPSAAAVFLKLPPSQPAGSNGTPSEDMARTALRHVRNTINEFRDGLWDGLVRVRNHLNLVIGFTGLFAYGLLAFAFQSTGKSSDRQEVVTAVTILYLIGAIVGLFNQLAVDSGTDTAVEDYGLSLARLINTALLSGLAAVFGVLLVQLLPTLGNNVSASASVKIPELVDIYNLAKHPFDLVLAAVFGLTPNLLVASLTQQANTMKADIKSSEAPTKAST